MKSKFNITIDENLKERLKEYCNSNGLSASAVITILLLEFLKDK